MSKDGKTYSDQEFALILSRASEMARTSEAGVRSSHEFSLDEMKAVAAEVGLDPALVERAARHLPMEAGQSTFERILGGPVKYHVESHFDTGLSAQSAAHLLSAVRADAAQQGEGQADSSGMSWHSAGEGSQVIVTAHAEGDQTRVRLIIDRSGALVAIGMFTFLGTVGAALATIVGFKVIEIQSPMFGWSVLAGVVLGCLAVGRKVWTSTARPLSGRLDSLMDTVSQSLAVPTDEAPSRDGCHLTE